MEEQGELSEEEKRRIDDRIHGRTSSSTIKEDTSFAPLVSASIVATATYVLLTTIFSSLLPLGRTILVACGILTPDTHTGLSLWSDFISLLVAAALFVCVWRVSKFDGPPHNKKEPTLTLKSDARQIEPQGERDRKRERAKRAAKILTDIFSRNADTTTVSKRNDSPVLDSLAFEEIYEELAISAEETIVIVFDNLDRLDSKGLQEAWGTLQIFANHFDQGPLGRQFALTQPHAQKSTKPWILLPISGNAFQLMDEFGTNSGTVSIAKLFIRVFEIPTLITTDWRGYFLSQAQKAFPNSTEEELSTVYAIASRTLLRTEGRTPRNAKRFINSMVSQARVFPKICLASIAVHCLMKDSYTLITRTETNLDRASGSTRSFGEFATDVIAGNDKLSPYIESFSGCADDLFGDLAMMTYGQFTPEAASEVFAVSQIRSMLSGRIRIDIYSVVRGNEGSWSLITKEIKEWLLSVSQDATPSWVFEALLSLGDKNSRHYEADSVERDHLASVLIASIANMRAGTRGCSDVISRFIPKCSDTTVSKLLSVANDALSSNLEKLLTLENGEREDEEAVQEARSLFLETSGELAPILAESYTSVSEMHSTVQTILNELPLGGHYAPFIVESIEHSSTANWLKDRPPRDLSELFSLLDATKKRVYSGMFDDPVLAAIKKNEFLSRMNLDNAAIEQLVILHDNSAPASEPANELLIVCWLLLNVYGIDTAQLLSSLQDSPIPTNGLCLCERPDHPYQNAAILALLIDVAANGNEELAGIDDDFCTRLVNKDSIKILRECNDDILPRAIRVASEHSAVSLAAKNLAQSLWSEDDCAKRDLDTCFLYFSLSTDVKNRLDYGRMLGRQGRALELMNSNFDYHWASIYLGVLEELTGGERTKYMEWLAAGIKELDSADWFRALGISQIGRLRDIMRSTSSCQQLPCLDRALRDRLCSAFPGKDMLKTVYEMMDVYECDLEGLARSLAEVDNLVVRYFAEYAPILKRCKWLETLSPSKRYEIVEELIKKRTARKCVPLVEIVSESANPKRLFAGNLLRIRETIKHHANLKSMPKAGKDACTRLLDLLK